MRRLFLTAAVLLLSYTGFSELSVEWIDENTIVVSGYGYGDITNETALGSCTNCLNISPAEMHDTKVNILGQVDSTLDDIYSIYVYCDSLDDGLSWLGNEIGEFRRFGNTTPTANLGNPDRVAFTNYVLTADNTQTALDLQHKPPFWTATSISSLGAYNNGIYDYATEIVAPALSEMSIQVSGIRSSASSAETKLNAIATTVRGITEESCQSCGSDSNGDSCNSCPCKEQWDTLLDYIRHIDDDQHVRFKQLNTISNNVFNIHERLDTYAQIVSRVLYQEGTIVVDDGENSWSNVYNRGSSELYDYDKSNVLQRIELLLYGFVVGSPTNWENKTEEEIRDYVDDIDDDFRYITNSVLSAHDEYKSNVQTLSSKFDALWSAMNFFGSGNLGNFAYGEPFQFDAYDFSPDFMNAADFRPLQQVCRTAMQIFYWTSGVVFLLYFWYRVVTFTTGISLRIINFFNQLMT